MRKDMPLSVGYLTRQRRKDSSNRVFFICKAFIYGRFKEISKNKQKTLYNKSKTIYNEVVNQKGGA